MKVKGCCIICKTEIDYDINYPFCKTCHEPYKDKTITYEINGQFCHLCGEKDDSINRFEPRCKYCKPFERKDNSINQIYLEKLDWYKNKNRLNQIHPQWTTIDKNNVILFPIAKLLKIISVTSEINTKQIFENSPLDLKRIINILHQWEFGFDCEPPILEKTDFFRIYDGRHRIIAAYLTNKKTDIPVIMTTIKK